MTPAVVADHALLVVAAVALVAAGLRTAARLDAGGLELALAALVFAASAVVVETLALGLVGGGGDGFALTVAALATWAVAWTLTRGHAPPAALAALHGRLRRAPLAATLGAGAFGGVVVGWSVFQLDHPFSGGDGLIYHPPIASAWVQNGRPGSVVEVLGGLPVANYPVTNEVVVAWAMAISRSWVVASVWSPVLFLAMLAGAWLALRELAVAVGVRALAVGAVAVLPLVVFGLGGPTTDIAATAWLAVAAGLAAASRRVPGLVLPAILAAALCLGTKTTPALLLAALAVLCAGPLRAAAAAQQRRLAAAVAVAVMIGGVWPLRNLLVHGSPLWPLVAAPWGDPVPAGLVPFKVSFLEHPRMLVGTHYQGYLDVIAGGLVLIAGGLALPLVGRKRAALAAAAAAAAALLAWGLAPYTGILTDDFAVGATRYLLPALAACALALALCARGGGRRRTRAVSALLAASIAWSCWRTAALGFPYVPSLAVLVGAAAAGGLLAWIARRDLDFDPRLLAAGAAIACVLGLALAADGYVGRHALTGLPDGPLLRAALPGLVNGSGAISSAPGTVVMLRGDQLEHSLSLIAPDETCAGLERRLRAGPVLLESDPPSPLYSRLTACLAGRAPVRARGYYDVYY
ncbi:MAG: hypothetical protein ACR2KV_11040 [Solirubrobacteraceae bacterium]